MEPADQLRTAARALRTPAPALGACDCTNSDQWFDRSICTCGSMHQRCSDCGLTIDGCPDDTNPTAPNTYDLRVADLLEATAMEWARLSKRDVPLPKKALALAHHINGDTP